MLARPEKVERVPRLLALPIVLLVSLAMWAGIVSGILALLGLL